MRTPSFVGAPPPRVFRSPVLSLALVLAACCAVPAGAIAAPYILISDGGAGDGSGGVVRVDPVTGAQSFVSPPGVFQLPVGIALEPGGTVLVSDYGPPGGPGQLVRLDPRNGSNTVVSVGDPVSSGGNRFIAPSGIVVDIAGN